MQKPGALDPNVYLSVVVKAPVPSAEAEVVSMEVEEAKSRLAEAAAKVRYQESQGSIPYGYLVKATVEAMSLGLSRQMIASVISSNMESRRKTTVVKSSQGVQEVVKVSKGIAARYIMLARWERGEWVEGETPLTDGVVVNDITFTKPVEALLAGAASFTAIWQAFKDVVRPTVQDLTKVADDPVVAIENAVANLGFRVKAKDKDGRDVLTTLPVTKPLAFVAVVHGLLKLPVAGELLPKAARTKLLDILGQAEEVIPPQAKTLTMLKGGKAA